MTPAEGQLCSGLMTVHSGQEQTRDEGYVNEVFLLVISAMALALIAVGLLIASIATAPADWRKHDMLAGFAIIIMVVAGVCLGCILLFRGLLVGPLDLALALFPSTLSLVACAIVFRRASRLRSRL
jgi:hypothetical protein